MMMMTRCAACCAKGVIGRMVVGTPISYETWSARANARVQTYSVLNQPKTELY